LVKSWRRQGKIESHEIGLRHAQNVEPAIDADDFAAGAGAGI